MIYKLDEVLKLSDKGVVYMPRPGRMRSCGRKCPAKVFCAMTMPIAIPQTCRAAAQFIQAPDPAFGAKADGAFVYRQVVVHGTS